MPLFDLLANSTSVRMPAATANANANGSRAELRSAGNSANRSKLDRAQAPELPSEL